MLAFMPALVGCASNTGEGEGSGTDNLELNIRIETGFNNCLVRWDSVANAAEYEIIYNNTTVAVTDSTKNEYLLDVSDNFFTVKVYANNSEGLVVAEEYKKCEASANSVDPKSYNTFVRENRRYVSWQSVPLASGSQLSEKYNVIINDEKSPVTVDKNEIDVTDYGEINKFAVRSADTSEKDGKIVFMKYNDVKGIRFFDENQIKNIVVTYKDNIIAWDKVDNAGKYLVTVKDSDGQQIVNDTVVSNQLFFDAGRLNKGTFSVVIKPVATVAENDMVYLGTVSSNENVFRYGEGVDSKSLKIRDGRLYWGEVTGCISYTVSGTCTSPNGNTVKVNTVVNANSYKLSMDNKYNLAVSPNYSDPKIYSTKSTDFEFTILSAPVMICEKSGNSMTITWDAGPMLQETDVKPTDFAFSVVDMDSNEQILLPVTEYKYNGFKVDFCPKAGNYKLNCLYAGELADVYSGPQVEKYVKKLNMPSVSVSYLANELKSVGTSGYMYADVKIACSGESNYFGFRNNNSVAYSQDEYVVAPKAMYESENIQLGVFALCKDNQISGYSTSDITFDIVLDSDDQTVVLKQKTPLSNIGITQDDEDYFFNLSATGTYINYFLDGNSISVTTENRIRLSDMVKKYSDLTSGEHGFFANTSDIQLSDAEVVLSRTESNGRYEYQVPAMFKKLTFKKYSAPEISLTSQTKNTRSISIKNTGSVSGTYAYKVFESQNGNVTSTTIDTDNYVVDLEDIDKVKEFFVSIPENLVQGNYILRSDNSNSVELRRAEAPQYSLSDKKIVLDNWQKGCGLMLLLSDESMTNHSEKQFIEQEVIDLAQLYGEFGEIAQIRGAMTVDMYYYSDDSDLSVIDSKNGLQLRITKADTPKATVSDGVLQLGNTSKGYQVYIKVKKPVVEPSDENLGEKSTLDLNEYFADVQGGQIEFSLRYVPQSETVLASDAVDMNISKADAPSYTISDGILSLLNNKEKAYQVQIVVEQGLNVGKTDNLGNVDKLDLNKYFAGEHGGAISFRLQYLTGDDAVLDSNSVKTSITKAETPQYTIEGGVLSLSNNTKGYRVEMTVKKASGTTEKQDLGVVSNINLNEYFTSVQGGQLEFELTYVSINNNVLRSNAATVTVNKLNAVTNISKSGNIINFDGLANKYRYAIDDGQWQYVDTNAFALPEDLAPGEHIVRIIAVGDGKTTIDSVSAQYSFTTE